MSNSSLGHKEQKINYTKFIWCFLLEIEVRIIKGHVNYVILQITINENTTVTEAKIMCAATFNTRSITDSVLMYQRMGPLIVSDKVLQGLRSGRVLSFGWESSEVSFFFFLWHCQGINHLYEWKLILWVSFFQNTLLCNVPMHPSHLEVNKYIFFLWITYWFG